MGRVQTAEGRRVAVNVSLDLGLLARLDAAAGREGATRSELLRRLLRHALDEEEREDEALAAAAEAAYHDPENQGRIPWEQVKAESQALP
jgi:metal-responsive CopG/Arc/MetJ family transcriptional regulator